MEREIKEYVDGIYEPAKEWAITLEMVSATMLQRRFRIGYTRAARIIDRLEENNIVGAAEGRGPRKVLVKE
ncbi:cell division protein FtsK [Bacillus thuringiensis]|uniref:DNA translocase FtsK n=1 Tax=Bacillus thuringiensis TaxID=1428 RepID=UPI00222411CB|nr:DNA translocase FtsK [Bacillus thuringiensis]UYX50050.1 cell division protein FtsK [Bacillus thuringiensis]